MLPKEYLDSLMAPKKDINTGMETDTSYIDNMFDKINKLRQGKTYETGDSIIETETPKVGKYNNYLSYDEGKNFIDFTPDEIANAIKTTESRGNYTAKGGSGESGAYQFMPSTWKSWVNEFSNDVNAIKDTNNTYDKQYIEIEKNGTLSMTPENQDAIAKWKISQLQKQGLNALEIASMWNSNNKNWEGNIGTNKYGVKYNTPEYVMKVANNLENIKSNRIGAQQNTTVEGDDTSTNNVIKKEEGVVDWLEKYNPGNKVIKQIDNIFGFIGKKIYDTGVKLEEAKNSIVKQSDGTYSIPSNSDNVFVRMASGEYEKNMLKNVPGDTWNVFKQWLNNIPKAIPNLINMAEGTLVETVANIIPGDHDKIVDAFAKLEGKDKTEIPKQMLTYLGEEFGSIDGFLEAMEDRPLQTIDDFSMVLNLSKTGLKASGASANTLKIIDQISDATDVTGIISKGIRGSVYRAINKFNTSPEIGVTEIKEVPGKIYSSAFKVDDNTVLAKKLDAYSEDLIKEGYIGNIDTLKKKVQKGFSEYEKMINEPELQAALNSKPKYLLGLTNQLLSDAKAMLDPAGNIKAGYEQQYRAINDVVTNLRSFKGSTYAEVLDYLQGIDRKTKGSTGDFKKAMLTGEESSYNSGLDIASEAIRDYLSENVKGLEAANSKYKYAITVQELIKETSDNIDTTIKRTKNQAQYIIPGVVGGLVGSAISGGSVVGTIGGAGLLLLGNKGYELFLKAQNNTNKFTIYGWEAQKALNLIQKLTDKDANELGSIADAKKFMVRMGELYNKYATTPSMVQERAQNYSEQSKVKQNVFSPETLKQPQSFKYGKY